MTALAGAVSTGGSISTAGAATKPSKAIGGNYDFDAIYDRVGSNCYKWDEQIKRYGKNMEVGMGIADMDFQAPECINEALLKRCSHQNWGYGFNFDTYKEAISEWNSERHGVEIDPGLVTLSDGVHPALIASLFTFTQPGTKVVMTSPVYEGFYGDLRATHTKINDSEMVLNNGRYEIDWDDFESRLTFDTQAMLLCNPQNPTGNCWTEEELLRIGELCLKNNVVVLADEIHCDFVTKGQTYIPFASLPDKDIVNNSLTFKAISKTFSLAAMTSAFFYSTNPVYLERVRRNHRAHVNALGAIANEAAYRHGGEWFDQLLPYIDANHDYVEAYTQERMPMVNYTKAQGTYLAWLDVSDVAEAIDASKNAAKKGLASPEHYIEQWFVEHAHVQLNPGSNYGTGGANHMRMNLGTPRPLIEKALDSMTTALKKV